MLRTHVNGSPPFEGIVGQEPAGVQDLDSDESSLSVEVEIDLTIDLKWTYWNRFRDATWADLGDEPDVRRVYGGIVFDPHGLAACRLAMDCGFAPLITV